jgi:O-antigen/teichoic acid export membrane protein
MKKKLNTHYKPLRVIAKGASIIIIGLIIGKMLEFFSRVIIARFIGPGNFGLFSLGLSFFWIATNVSVMGFGYGVMRYVAYYKGRNNFNKINDIISTAFKIVIFISILFFITFLFFSNQISLIFSDPKLSIILQILSIGVPVYSFAIILFAIMKGLQTVKYKTLTEDLIRNFSAFSIVIILLYLGYSTIGVTFAYLLSFIIAAVISYYIVKKKLIQNINFIKKSPLSRELITFSLPMSFSSISSIIVRWADTIVLGYYLTTAVVGIYNSAILVASLLLVLDEALNCIFLPVTSELYSRNKLEDLKKVYKTSTRWIFLIIFPTFLMILFFPVHILSLLFGKKYIEASMPLIILSLGYTISLLFSLSTYVIISLGKTKINFLVSLASLVTSISLNILLVPVLGTNGAATATISALIIANLIPFIFTYKYIKVQPFDLKYIKPFLAALTSMILIYAPLSYFKIEVSRFDLFIIFPAFILLYFFLLVIFKVLNEEDIMILRAVEKKTGIKIKCLDRIIKRFI